MIKKDYLKLNKSLQKRLICFLVALLVPIVFYVGGCLSAIIYERIDTIDKYIKGSNNHEIYDIYDNNQVKYHNYLKEHSKENSIHNYYCEVKVGTVIERIKSISSATSTYEARMQLFFYFDKNEFQNMFYRYASLALSDQIMNDYYSQCSEIELEQGRDLNFEKFMNNELYFKEHHDFFENWVFANDHRYYPGEAASNVLVDNETMFEIGNGEFVPDSYGTLKSLEERPYDGGIMCYQKVKFTARFEKYFNSVRYPLDSVQFKMYIMPIMDSQFIRYVPLRTDQNNNPISGFSSYFGLTDGYRLINTTKKISNFSLRIHYYNYVNNEPTINGDINLKTELEIIVRANREGIQLFLQAFMNLFSVLIWISIAFYNQAFNKKNSLDMLGTGLFGVISSMIVGLSLLSDSGIFSLITMNNIFALAVVLIMTTLSISYEKVLKNKNQTIIVYQSLKLRIVFYILLGSMAIMFGGLPLLSYMFGL